MRLRIFRYRHKFLTDHLLEALGFYYTYTHKVKKKYSETSIKLSGHPVGGGGGYSREFWIGVCREGS